MQRNFYNACDWSYYRWSLLWTFYAGRKIWIYGSFRAGVGLELQKFAGALPKSNESAGSDKAIFLTELRFIGGETRR